MHYYFSAFNYDVDQKTLYHDKEKVEIPKKCHELLLYLLENRNKLINREDLIDHVWHGRVVTHNTIDQSILKLRKALNQKYAGDYIESVYGQGIRFLPEITKQLNKSQNPSPDSSNFIIPNQFKITQWVMLLSVVFLIFLWLFYQPNKSQNQSMQIPSSKLDISGINNQVSASDDSMWLLKGGRYYLQHLITQASDIRVTKNTIQNSTASEPSHLTIEITRGNLHKEIIQINVEQNNNNQAKLAYTAHLQTQQAKQNVRETVIHANQLTTLFPSMATWITDSKSTEVTTQHQHPQVYSADEFALQSYLQAMYQQANGNSAQALTYLEAAVEQDPSFKTAWYQMAIALRKQSDPRKALGILNALITDEPNLAYQVSLVKSQCLDALAEYEAATTNYEKTLYLAQQLKQPRKLAAVYISQGILFRKIKQFEKAENVLDQAAAIIDIDSQPQLFGTIMNTHAKLAREMNQPLVAIEKAKSAINAFQKSGDRRYQMQAKTVLASILRLRNEFKIAEQLVKESLFHAEQLKNHRGISDNRTKLARIYQQTGRFRLALEQWQMVLSLNAELELFTNSADAYLWLIHLHLIENNVDQAEVNLKLLAQLYNEQPVDVINKLMTEAQLIMALFKQDLVMSQQNLTALVAIDHELINMYQGDVAMLRHNFAAAELHYLETLVNINPLARYDQMELVLNRLNLLYLTHNTEKLSTNLLRTQTLNPFIYPLQKYQAMAAKAVGNQIKSISLMEELKLKAGDYWQYKDQLLLESMQE